jgi:hypothetical protein
VRQTSRHLAPSACRLSDLGQKAKFPCLWRISALPTKARSALRSEADMRGVLGHVRLGPITDI